MKQKINYIIAVIAILMALVVPATTVVARGANSGSDNSLSVRSSSSSDNSDDESTETKDTREVETEIEDQSERIAEFKKRFKVKLGVSEIARIKLKCVGAQSVVGKLYSKFGSKAKPRSEAYANLERRLDALVPKLKAHDVDTTTLEQQITELKSKIATFNEDKTAYSQAISDLKEVACKNDPDGFQAALLAARTAHETLVNDIKAIRTFIVETLRPTLQTIKQQMEGKENKDDSEETDQSNSNDTEGSN